MTERYLKGLEDSNNYISKELHNNVCNELLATEMQLQQANASQLAAQLGVIRETVRNISHQLSTPNFSNISLYQMLNLYIIRKSKFPQNPKRSVRFSGKRTKRSVQKRKARNTQKAETKVL